jgi:hypothetical protein
MTKKSLEKLKPISNLKEEIRSLRSFLIWILGKDREGEYSSKFVRRILRSAREKAIFTFKNKESFLKQIRKKS